MAKELIKRNRLLLDEERFVELVAWKVPKDKDHQEGIKYSFTYVKEGKRILGIDNYNREGHHKHIQDRKKPYNFTTLKKAEEDFYKMIEEFENENQRDKHKD